MASSILTPVTLWQEIKMPFSKEAEVISETVEDGFSVKKVYFTAREIDDWESVKVYGVLVEKEGANSSTAVLVEDDIPEDINMSLLKHVALMGYKAFSIDLKGESSAEYRTVYPESVKYANYNESKDDLLHVPEDGTETCWFEWVLNTLYAIDYLYDIEHIEKVGLLGVNDGANVLWKTAALDRRVCASCFIGGFGWEAYKGHYKFAEESDPEFSDRIYRWLSGFDAQTYAKFITSPVYVISETNSGFADADRAYDTLLRVPEKYSNLMYYTIGADCYIDSVSLNNLFLFFEKYLNGRWDLVIPKRPELSMEVKDGGVAVTVTYDRPEEVTSVKLYASEEIVDPTLRDWNILEEKNVKGEKNTFFYHPAETSGIAFFIADITYVNGFTVSTGISAKRFEKSEIQERNSDRILYNSGMGKDIPFIPAVDKNRLYCGFILLNEQKVLLEEGPFSIMGITAQGGLKTYKINDPCDKPEDNAVLRFDIYSEEPVDVEVSFIEEANKPEQKSYVFRQRTGGNKVWNSIMVEPAKCLSRDNIPFKSFEKINALQIKANGKFLLNNILWI